MGGPYRRSLDRPDETLRFGDLLQDSVDIGDFTVARVVHPPGWRWSTDMRPIVGGDRCMARHVGFVISGRVIIELADGTTIELGPNDVYDIPPGHDGYVVGDEPHVALDWAGVHAWTGHTGLRNRVLAGLVMTDIVDSTAEAVRLGDAAWRDMLGGHFEALRTQLDRFGGREIDTTGDGIFAMFDGAARALRCAEAFVSAAERAGVRIRAGVHVGEVELSGSRVQGAAVHEVARVMSKAGAGEILVSEPTRALALGPEFDFEDRGLHDLKGLPEARRLYRYLPGFDDGPLTGDPPAP